MFNRVKEPNLFRNSRILLVDDENVWLKLLERSFRARGYHNIEVCQDSFEAMTWVKTKNYDLVVFDLVMPGYTGADLLMGTLKHSPTTPVIIISGMIQAGDVERFSCMGAYGHCLKTDDPDDVFTMVEAALEQHQDVV